MNRVLAILMLFTVLQFVNSYDQNLVKCYKKLKTQINHFKTVKTFPKCIDTSALVQAMKEIKVYDDIYKQIRKDCRANVGECMKIITKTLNEKEAQIKESLKQLLTHLTKALSGCYSGLEKTLSNINGFIANGCEIPKK